MSASFDFSDISKLAADLGEVPEKLHRNVLSAVKVTALKTKRDWQEPLKGSASIPGGARSISYDIKTSRDGVSAEIGPEIGGPGALVGMLEYGTPSTGPTGYGHAALQKNEADFVKGILLATEDVL